MLQWFLEGGRKHSQGGIWRQSVEQRLKERPSRVCPTWESIPYIATKPRHHCGCWEVHADRSLIWLSFKKLCQILTNTEADAHSQPLVPDGKVGEETEGAEGICSPMKGAAVLTGQTPLELQGTGPPSKQYTWRFPWLWLHMRQRMALLDICGNIGP